MRNLLLTLALAGTTALSAQSGIAKIEQPVAFEGDTIYGTLTTTFPRNSKKFGKEPLIIIIPGSGPTDRDGNSTMLPGPNNSFLQLADSLATEGIATYRYDKLGVAASTTGKSEDELRFDHNMEVVKNIFAKMKEIGFSDIYLLGHSEGSLIGMIAAQELDVDGYISVAGAGRNTYDILQEQLSKQLQGEMLESTMRKLDSIKEGHTVTKYNPMLASLLRPSVQPYLRSMFQYDPAKEIAKLNKPVLIIQGERDLQVATEDARTLKDAATGAELAIYPDMNHVLKVVDESQTQNTASYYDPDFRLHPRLIEEITRFVKEN